MEDTASKIIGALLKRFADGKSIVLTNEEIEDAPDFEMRDDFVMDRIEMRVSTYGE